MSICIKLATFWIVFALLNLCATDPLCAADPAFPSIYVRPTKFRNVEVHNGKIPYRIRSEFPNLAQFKLQPSDELWLRSEIKRLLRTERKNFRKKIKYDVKSLYIDGIPTYSTFESTCTVSFVSSNIISIHFDFESSPSDGLPMHFTKVLNFSLLQHSTIDLTDLFGPTHVEEALTRISAYSSAELNNKLQDSEFCFGIANWIDEGTKPNLENFGTFTISTGGLQFFFPEYQVAAYAFGPQQVFVPWTLLDDLVDG